MANPPNAPAPAELSIPETKIIARFCLGDSHRAIARVAGVSVSSVARFLKTPEALAAIEDERQRIRQIADYDVQKAFLDLAEAAEMARLTKDAKTLNSIIRTKADLAGLIVQQQFRVSVGDRVDLSAAIAAARARVASIPPRAPALPVIEAAAALLKPVDPFED